ncbi:MAG TPA: NTPase [Dehalococcoidia bacterium]|nr:NTPase [Dehalococcoidia bacterium]
MKRVYLLSGKPGSGKTTIIKEVLSRVGRSAGGFYTEEIRDRGVRQGFRIITLDGNDATLAHVSIPSPYRVSKYGVDVGNINEVAVPSVREAIHNRDVVVIDEIGKMELFSEAFKDAVLEAIESGKKVLGTIILASHPWADGVKRRVEVEIIPVARDNQHEVIKRLMQWLES